jgi:hypothetical protein
LAIQGSDGRQPLNAATQQILDNARQEEQRQTLIPQLKVGMTRLTRLETALEAMNTASLDFTTQQQIYHKRMTDLYGLEAEAASPKFLRYSATTELRNAAAIIAEHPEIFGTPLQNALGETHNAAHSAQRFSEKHTALKQLKTRLATELGVKSDQPTPPATIDAWGVEDPQYVVLHRHLYGLTSHQRAETTLLRNQLRQLGPTLRPGILRSQFDQLIPEDQQRALTAMPALSQLLASSAPTSSLSRGQGRDR